MTRPSNGLWRVLLGHRIGLRVGGGALLDTNTVWLSFPGEYVAACSDLGPGAGFACTRHASLYGLPIGDPVLADPGRASAVRSATVVGAKRDDLWGLHGRQRFLPGYTLQSFALR